MKTPSLEEVKAHFKDAKEVRCLADGDVYVLDFTKKLLMEKESIFLDNQKCRNYICLSACLLWKDGKYAEIISYKETFEYLEEVEVSDDNSPWFIRQFISNLPDGTFATWTKEVGQLSYYKHIRKLNTERTKAIETIKELMLNHKIELNEIK